MDQIDRRDLLAFATALRDDEELAPRTVHSHFANTVAWLNWAGHKELTRKGDWPVYTEEEPEAYEPEELAALFKACDPGDKRLFHFFLMTGFREQEVQFLTYKDVNLNQGTVSVTHKPQFNWTPKAYKARTVPVPAAFLAELVADPGKPGDLVFCTASGKPDTHMLRTLKRIAERAGLDAESFWLHKFRATFATTCLQNGVDLKTVSAWLGHSDLASTMRYLKAARGAAVREKVESIWQYASS